MKKLIEEEKILLQFTREDLIKYSNSLSDILCWIQGFKAGLSEEREHLSPYGFAELAEFNYRIKQEIKGSF